MGRLEELTAEAERLLALNKAGNPARSSVPEVVADAFRRGDEALRAKEALRDRDEPKMPPAEKAIRLAELRCEVLRWRGISGPRNVSVRVTREVKR